MLSLLSLLFVDAAYFFVDSLNYSFNYKRRQEITKHDKITETNYGDSMAVLTLDFNQNVRCKANK